jgi:tyrosyl-tRNA synthetase
MQAAETARRTFEEGALAEGLPTFEIERAKLEAGIPFATLANTAKLTSSSGEARRFIQAGGLRVNDVPVTDVRAIATLENLTPEGVLKLSVGKKQHILVKPV